MDLSLRTNFTLTCAGPTGSGKTTWLGNLIRCAPTLYDVPPGPFYYFYKIWQDKFAEMERDYGVHFVEGICSMNWLRKHIKPRENATIIIDDLARDLSQDTAEIFGVGAHHFGCNVCFVTQNLFEKNPAFRNISLNSRNVTSSNYVIFTVQPFFLLCQNKTAT